ncbi:MAG: hypothetical protein JWP22_2137, partial [Ramlibacter sp.]|nr:hypothetical protein [Ramlibacter sp.]
GHRAALRAFAALRRGGIDADHVPLSQAAGESWRQRWTGQTLMATDVREHGEEIARKAVGYFGP